MLHFRRYIAALAVLLAAFGLYYVLVAPWLEPPPIGRPPVADIGPVQPSPGVESELAELFPPDAWERDPQTKVVETSQCILLVKDYLPTPDGRLELNPCTLVFYTEGDTASLAGGTAMAGGGTNRRPIVLQAPEGAVLIFDRPLEIGRGQFGQIVGGKLEGEVTISSPPSQPDGDDALRLVTRNVQLAKNRIFTPGDVAI
ncbi:MAG TPA: hypothetical protein VFV87_17435, partial [Pirellulaceae bacterium]|nr:hypothetical protein [Pirellulaceae bacterium]